MSGPFAENRNSVDVAFEEYRERAAPVQARIVYYMRRARQVGALKRRRRWLHRAAVADLRLGALQRKTFRGLQW